MTVMSESEDDLNAEEGTHYIDTLDMSRTSVYFIPVMHKLINLACLFESIGLLRNLCALVF